MKNFLNTTALVLAMSTAAIADDHMAKFDPVAFEKSDFFASDLIGMRIYNAEGGADETAGASNDMVSNWDDIGEINDVIVTPEGDVRAVILGVGGFLGIGEKDVAVSMDDIKIMTGEGESADRFLVIQSSMDALKAAPAFEYPMMEEATNAIDDGDFDTTRNEFFDGDAEADAEKMADADSATSAPMDREPLARPMVERDGFAEKTPAEVSALTAEDLQGQAVYGSNDETVGEVDALIMNDDGDIDRVVVNVGGFLGLGEKPVALSFDELQILRNGEDESLRIYVDNTEEALKALPEWSEQS